VGAQYFNWCIEFCCNVCWPEIMGHEWHTTQGKGSYESRAEMLHLIVELVQASCIADNPEWRWASATRFLLHLQNIVSTYICMYIHMCFQSMVVNCSFWNLYKSHLTVHTPSWRNQNC
jgi:hypothetical protein